MPTLYLLCPRERGNDLQTYALKQSKIKQKHIYIYICHIVPPVPKQENFRAVI